MSRMLKVAFPLLARANPRAVTPPRYRATSISTVSPWPTLPNNQMKESSRFLLRSHAALPVYHIPLARRRRDRQEDSSCALFFFYAEHIPPPPLPCFWRSFASLTPSPFRQEDRLSGEAASHSSIIRSRENWELRAPRLIIETSRLCSSLS